MYSFPTLELFEFSICHSGGDDSFTLIGATNSSKCEINVEFGVTVLGGSAQAISGDGTTIVGAATMAAGTEAFRWTAASGMVLLGDWPGGFHSSGAYAVSADGSVLAGSAQDASGWTSFLWTADLGMVNLLDYLVANGATELTSWQIIQAQSDFLAARAGCRG